VIDGVLVLRIRRLVGSPDDERALAAWAANADEDFAHERVVVDLRGNSGGNDGYTYTWVEPRLRAVDGFCTTATWCVQGKPLGYWNAVAWKRALYGRDAVSSDWLAQLHDPRPDDEIAVLEETYDLPAGDRPWEGRMLVLVDGASRSSGESSAWLLREGLGARLLGEPTFGMIEYGNTVPYPLPRSGLVVSLPTKSNDYGFPVESIGFPVDVPLDPKTPVEDVVRQFDSFV
jgi:C-terminal processing protease CtpA/Prc